MSSICTHFWKKYTERSNLFSIFVANEIFETLFTKRDLIRYYCLNNIDIFYWNRSFSFSISVSPNFITVFYIFIYTFTFKKFYILFLIYSFLFFSFELEFKVNLQLQNLLLIFNFYNVPHVLVISIFCKNFIALLLLIPLTIQP